MARRAWFAGSRPVIQEARDKTKSVRLFVALIAVLIAIALVLMRPRVRGELRFGPASGSAVGVLLMLVTGVIVPHDLLKTALELYRPVIGVAALMALTALAHGAGVFDRLARFVEKGTRGPVPQAFFRVFVIAALVSAAFNNDAAILMLTPLLVPLLRRLYPLRPYLLVPFSFAIFVAAGVAPLATSNPMNFLVAELAGISFNTYALRMAPVAVVCWIVSYLVLRLVFSQELTRDPLPARGGTERGSLPPMGLGGKRLLSLLALVLVAYPVVSYYDGPVWAVAAAGAVLAILLGWRDGSAPPSVAGRGVAWDVLAFLYCAFVMVHGLEKVGVIAALSSLYGSVTGPFLETALVGSVSSLGSAVINNHPMAILNSSALSEHPRRSLLVLAALVGGDLGPRLLPIGSLAGLLWMEMLRRSKVDIPLWQFVRVGVLVTVPTLAACLLVLYLLAA
jgi:arsenical pump membrane protein